MPIVHSRKIIVIAVHLFVGLSLAIWTPLGISHSAAADTPSDHQTDISSNDAAAVDHTRPVEASGIDQPGEKVNKGLDIIGQWASQRMGEWIARKAFAGITWLSLIFCLALLMCVVILERVVRWLLHHKINSIPVIDGQTPWHQLLLNAVAKPLSLFIWVYGIYAALSPLYSYFLTADGSNAVHFIAKRAADIGGTVALFWFLYLLVSLLDVRLKRWASGSQSSIDEMLVPLVGKTLRLFIVIIGVIMVLQNLTGIQIGPLIASLGIGGLAVAFAAKDSIANFFGTLTILFDKPFQVGERIVIDAYDGVVENVGFRSTRIRTLTGHLVSIPNEKIVNSGLENIGRRPHIRWLTQIGITYDTPPQKVREAVDILRSILENHEGMHPDFPPRVYFNGFNDWSLNITVVVWYHPPDWWQYQEWLQGTCVQIMERFQAADIDFAYPSRTLYLANEDKRQLKLQLLKGSTAQEQE